MKKRFIAIALCLTLFVALTLSACNSTPAPAEKPDENANTPVSAEGTDGDAITWTWPCVLSKDHATMITAQMVIDEIKEKSDGKFIIELYTDGALGGNEEIAEGVAYGTFDMGITHAGVMAPYASLIEAFQLPYLIENVSDTECAKAVYLESDCFQPIKDQLEANSIIFAAPWSQGYRQLTTTKTAVRAPSDLKGLKIRVMNSTYHMLAWDALGANPTPMSFGEVFTALQQGAIDGQENPYATFCQAGMGEVQKYVIETSHIYDMTPVIISKTSYEALPAEYQELLIETLNKYTEQEWNLMAEQDSEYRQSLVDSGKVEVITLTDEERAAFRDATQSVYDAFIQDKGPEAQALIDKIHEVQQAKLK